MAELLIRGRSTRELDAALRRFEERLEKAEIEIKGLIDHLNGIVDRLGKLEEASAPKRPGRQPKKD